MLDYLLALLLVLACSVTLEAPPPDDCLEQVCRAVCAVYDGDEGDCYDQCVTDDSVCKLYETEA